MKGKDTKPTTVLLACVCSHQSASSFSGRTNIQGPVRLRLCRGARRGQLEQACATTATHRGGVSSQDGSPGYEMRDEGKTVMDLASADPGRWRLASMRTSSPRFTTTART